MSMSTVDNLAMPDDLSMDDGNESLEVRPLLPTPERVSQLLEMSIDDVRSMYGSADQRLHLVDEIMEQRDELIGVHNNIYRDEIEELINIAGEHIERNPDLDLAELELHLHEAQATLAAKRDFFLETSPDEFPEGAEDKAAILEKMKESEVATGSKEERSMWRKAWDAVTWLPRKHPVITALLALAATAWGIYAVWDLLGEAIIVPNPMDGAAGVAETLVPPTGGEFGAIPQGGIAPPNSVLPGTPPVEGVNPGDFFQNGPM